MTGKEKCEILKAIRREIAKINSIPFPAWMEKECGYQGDDCRGTCPKCEAEIGYLEEMLNEMAAAGIKLRLSGISADAIPTGKFGGNTFVELDELDLLGELQPPDDLINPEVGYMVFDDDWNSEDL